MINDNVLILDEFAKKFLSSLIEKLISSDQAQLEMQLKTIFEFYQGKGGTLVIV
jgi:ethanolamine utilization protein EutQ (cupin superfamily)